MCLSHWHCFYGVLVYSSQDFILWVLFRTVHNPNRPLNLLLFVSAPFPQSPQNNLFCPISHPFCWALIVLQWIYRISSSFIKYLILLSWFILNILQIHMDRTFWDLAFAINAFSHTIPSRIIRWRVVEQKPSAESTVPCYCKIWYPPQPRFQTWQLLFWQTKDGR